MRVLFVQCMVATVTVAVARLSQDEVDLAIELFIHKAAKHVCYFTCDKQHNNIHHAKEFMKKNLRVSVQKDNITDLSMQKLLFQWNTVVGVLLDGACDSSENILRQGSKLKLLDATHAWLVMAPDNDTDLHALIQQKFYHLNLSLDTDLVVAGFNGGGYSLADVFNFGKVQGNGLEIASLGSWRSDTGLNVSLNGFKYYHRWDFHNLTLRAISVILEAPEVFRPELLSNEGYTAGIAAMTKITSQLLNLLKHTHNFRFNYTIAGRWIDSPERNSTLAVTNSLYWGEQDISSTCARIFPLWLNWVDICFPPTTELQTKFYYLIPKTGVGVYENRFLTPLSLGAWWCTLAACGLCTVVLAAAATMEGRPKPTWYAFFSVSAAICQQDFDDGIQYEEKFSSQGRKLTLLVVGLTSMLLYNYYTSSVVSWLLNAAAPSIDSLEQLMNSEFELIFEDIGYSRGWIAQPGFYYYSGFINPKEDELRDKKVISVKRTMEPLQPVAAGIELMRTGAYAFHTEPYTASQVISKTFQEEELCDLGSLQMMTPAHVYIMVQKRSPYKEFFVWRLYVILVSNLLILMRLSERGHFQASRSRFAGTMPTCSGRRPRALALGQAAPAFLLLLQFNVVSVLILIMEILWHRITQSEPLRQ